MSKQFGRWTVLEEPKGRMWLCECSCGTVKNVDKYNLMAGISKSCGCLNHELLIQRNYTHRLDRNDKRYGVWATMKGRCLNKSNKKYKDYGARGITVCDEWLDYPNFYKWAEENGYREGLSLDRIDNDKGYYPDNCRWTDAKTQASNTRRNVFITINGVSRTMSAHSRVYGIHPETLRKRYIDGLRDLELVKPPYKAPRIK